MVTTSKIKTPRATSCGKSLEAHVGSVSVQLSVESRKSLINLKTNFLSPTSSSVKHKNKNFLFN